MISQFISGDSLGERELCLTFDDGPGESPATGTGPKTLDLAQYLADQGVPATFFLCGKYVRQMPDAPARLRALGHTVGNHTETHPDLVDLAARGGDVVGELVRTAELLGVADGEKVWFRPPYGRWNEQVGALLDAEPELSSHAGPVVWNISGDDWRHWKSGSTPRDCADEYLVKIDEARRGVVLLHDCTADSDVVRAANQTYETVQLLVPELRQRGYSFVPLDAVGHTGGRE